MSRRLRASSRLIAFLFFLACAAPAHAQTTDAQITVPTFGIRGVVPDGVATGVMSELRNRIAVATGMRVSPGELITPGIAGSLEPEFTELIAEVEGTRFALSGEIGPNLAVPGEYAITMIVVDAEEHRSTDLLNATFAPDAIPEAVTDLVAQVAEFTQRTSALPQGSAALFISSEPRDAEVFIDSVAVGRTVDLEVRLAPGRYQLEVRKEGFLPEMRTVELRAEAYELVHVILTAIAGGSIQVATEPPARIYLDGAFVGSSPATFSALPGSHTLRLEREGFATRVLTVPVRNYRVTRVRDALEPRSEPLLFWPERREFLVYIDGQLQPGGFARDLAPGLVTIELRRGDEHLRVLRAIPGKGAFELDLETAELIPMNGADAP